MRVGDDEPALVEWRGRVRIEASERLRKWKSR